MLARAIDVKARHAFLARPVDDRSKLTRFWSEPLRLDQYRGSLFKPPAERIVPRNGQVKHSQAPSASAWLCRRARGGAAGGPGRRRGARGRGGGPPPPAA